MELKGSQTENNLRSAISGEAQAALLYEFFAKRARKDGFEGIADLFETTSENEKAHAEIYYRLLSCLATTEENLLAAAASEHHENAVMYPDFARKAREEGFTAIADTFDQVGAIEVEHEKAFRQMADEIKNNTVFAKAQEIEWICTNCGHRHRGTTAPTLCPVCSHPRSYFVPATDL